VVLLTIFLLYVVYKTDRNVCKKLTKFGNEIVRRGRVASGFHPGGLF